MVVDGGLRAGGRRVSRRISELLENLEGESKEQAGAELCQAQVKLDQLCLAEEKLGFTFLDIHASILKTFFFAMIIENHPY